MWALALHCTFNISDWRFFHYPFSNLQSFLRKLLFPKTPDYHRRFAVCRASSPAVRQDQNSDPATVFQSLAVLTDTAGCFRLQLTQRAITAGERQRKVAKCQRQRDTVASPLDAAGHLLDPMSAPSPAFLSASDVGGRGRVACCSR